MSNHTRVQSTYPDRLLAFVDILGWSDLVRESERRPTRWRKIGKAIELIGVWANGLDEFYPGGFEHESTHFSDTLVVSCPPSALNAQKLIHTVQLLCLRLLEEGVYTRGSVVRGGLHHDHMVIVGPALIEAHLLEKNVAKYPRVIVTPRVVQLLAAYARQNGRASDDRSRVRKDRDGLCFVDFLGQQVQTRGYLSRIRNIRRRIDANFLRHSKDLCLLSKDGWLSDYLALVSPRPPNGRVRPNP